MKVEDINKVAVIGSGLMGHGIAQEFATAGYKVRVQDITEEKLEQAVQNISRNLKLLVEIGVLSPEIPQSAMDNIYTSTDLEDVVTDVDIAIEAVFEDLALKKQIFGEMDRICPEHTILASNTSTFMPSKMSPAVNRPDRFLVAHFFNPPYLIPLVELVASPETSKETMDTMYALMKKMGKSPAIIAKEAPGFIANRLQAALLREALSIVERGIASAEDVDTVIKSSFGRRLPVIGVFEQVDMVGIDLVLKASQEVQMDIESRPQLSNLIEEKINKGELGFKTGKGFYEWTPESANALREKLSKALINIAQW